MDEHAGVDLGGTDAEFRQRVADRILRLEVAHADLISKLGYEDYQRRLFAMTEHRHKTSEIDDFYMEVSKLFST